jgi:RHS repeat-associated protein
MLVRLTHCMVVLAIVLAIVAPAFAHTPPTSFAPELDLRDAVQAEPREQSLPFFSLTAFDDVTHIDLPPPALSDRLEARLDAITNDHASTRTSLPVLAVSAELASALLPSSEDNNFNENRELGLKTRWGTAFQALPFEEPATGLVYVRNRWYAPTSGTFLSPDPLGYRDSANLYAYCGGDPVNCSDPTGNKAEVRPNGDIVGVRPDKSTYSISAADARRDPVLALRVLESDPDLGFDDQERIMTEAGLPIPYSSACRQGEACIESAKNNRAFTHLPRGGARGYVEGLFVGAAGLPPATREQQLTAGGVQITEAIATTGVVAYGGVRNKAQVQIGPRDESALDRRPYIRGYQVEDVRQRESYPEEQYVRSKRFQRRADFSDLTGIEKVELKSLDVTKKSYDVTNINDNGLKSTLEGYRDQLTGYDRVRRTPINVLEIQLINTRKMTFAQDQVFRQFVQESLSRGVFVEVHDYSSGRVIIRPR